MAQLQIIARYDEAIDSLQRVEAVDPPSLRGFGLRER
jgi:hypothetical protein